MCGIAGVSLKVGGRVTPKFLENPKIKSQHVKNSKLRPITLNLRSYSVLRSNF